MTVTTGGRAASIVGVLEDLRLVVVVGRADLARDQDHRLVAERLRDRDHLTKPHHDLDDLSAAERSLTLMPEGTVTGPVGAATGACRG